MAANVLCVIRDDGFKDTAKRLDISENQLEGILHEYFNDPAVVDKKTYPSDKFILSKVQGQPFLGDENQVYLWNQKYNQPIQAANVQELNALKEHLEQFFPPESIGVKEKQNNTFEVSVKKPVDSTELDSIKKKALTDGTFMKAPNGKDSNLNEQQWLQVRTKAFKAWFGDWEKDPANASKVVDENGEPLVVWHGTKENNVISKFYRRGDAGIHFGTKNAAKERREQTGDDNPVLMPVFLNIKKPSKRNKMR